MKAVMAIQPGVLAMGDLPMPEPGEYEALVRMDACSICNSTDHKLLHGEFFSGTFPVVLGHEVVSTVVEVGPRVEHFRPGDRVFRQRLGDHHVPGEGRSCWGGFAEYGLVIDEWARQGVAYGPDPLPHDQQRLLADIDPAAATVMITLMETLDCCITCGVTAHSAVAVVGTGPVALATAKCAKLLGAAPVVVFGRRPEHADRFHRIGGADDYVAARPWDAQVNRIVKQGGFDVVIEAVGSVEALDLAIELAGGEGRVGVYGIAPGSAGYRESQLQRSNVALVRGVKEGRRQAQLLAWIDAGRLALDEWITHRVPMTAYRQAFDLAHQGDTLKVVMLPAGPGSAPG